MFLFFVIVRIAELAYGDASLNDLITPGSVLVFELQLLEVQGGKDEEL